MTMRRLAHPQTLVVIGLVAIALYAMRHTLSSTTLIVFAVAVPSIILHELAHGVTALALRRRHGQASRAAHPQPPSPHRPDRHPGPARRAGPGRSGRLRVRQAGADQPRRMRNPRNSALIVSLAGPATNLALAGLSILLLRLARPAGTAQAVNFVVSNFGVGALAPPTGCCTCSASST